MKALLTTALLAGLATSAAAQERITWWYEAATPERQKQIDELLVQPFEAANPNYNLVIDYRGNELDKQLRVTMLSGSGPDVVYTAGPSYVAPMAQAGQLLPLDDYPSSTAGTARSSRSSSTWAATTASSTRCPRPTRRSASTITRRCSTRMAGRRRPPSPSSNRSPTR